MSIFFTADTHFGHQNIIRHCKRPWQSAQEMNEELLHRWNTIVGPHDTVYHLGDLGFGSVKRMEALLPLLKSLRGKKYLIPGNHDIQGALKSYGGIFEILPALVEIRQLKGVHKDQHKQLPITLCHYPMHSWNYSFHGAMMFHGHEHGVMDPFLWRLDVGVDAWDYRPVAFEDAEQHLRLRKEYLMSVHPGYFNIWGLP